MTRRDLLRLLALGVLPTLVNPSGALAALDFDGTNDKVDHGAVAGVSGATAFTAAGWWYIDTLENLSWLIGNPSIFRMGSTAAGEINFGTSSTNYGALAGGITAGVWIHWALVFDGSLGTNELRMKGYKDGSLLTLTMNGTIPASLPGAAADIRIMENPDNSVFLDGRVAFLKLWNAALTPEQIVLEMHSYRPVRTDNLLLSAPYDDAAQARDYSGRGFHGTVTEAVQSNGPPVSYGGD